MSKKNDGFQVRDRRRGFAMIDNALIDEYGPHIGAYGIAAYCILARFARSDGTDSYPSYQTVADLMKASRPTAIKAIRKLVDAGLIEKESRKIHGESISNIYTLLEVKPRPQSPEVGSKPDLPPSQRALPRDKPDLPRGKRALPDQDTYNKTPITREQDVEGEIAAAPPARTPATPKAPRLPNDGYEMPVTNGHVAPTEPTPKQLQRWAPQVDPRKFKNGYIPPGAGNTPTEVWYESFAVTTADTRLNAPDQDDLRVCTDLDKLRKVITAFRRCDFKRKKNIQLVLDWYRDGIPDKYLGTTNGAGNGTGFGLTAYAEKERKQYERDYGPDTELTPEKEQWIWEQKRRIAAQQAGSQGV